MLRFICPILLFTSFDDDAIKMITSFKKNNLFLYLEGNTFKQSYLVAALKIYFHSK